MNQAFETQLQVVQRALGDAVLPALINAEPYVIEQLHLSMAALGFMQQRLRYERGYYRCTILNYISMAEAIIELFVDSKDAEIGELDALIVKGRALLDSPAADVIDYRHFTAELRASIAALTAASQNSAYESALDALIIDRSGPILMQERVWCIPLGFELRPQDLAEPDWERIA